MSGLLALWKQHTVTIEPYLGTNSNGAAAFGPAVTVDGWLEETVKIVRSKDGAEVVSSAQLHCDLGSIDAPELSRGTLPSGRVAKVVATARLDGGRISALPSHLQIAFE